MRRGRWAGLFGAGLAGAAVAGIAVFLVLRPPGVAPQRFVAVMQSDRAAPAWVVEADPQGCTQGTRPASSSAMMLPVISS